MSNDQQDQDTSDFWEFVACAKCRMPFALESGVATVPFWLTECGHVMCNNHISSWIQQVAGCLHANILVQTNRLGPKLWSMWSSRHSSHPSTPRGLDFTLQNPPSGSHDYRWRLRCRSGFEVSLRPSRALRTLRKYGAVKFQRNGLTPTLSPSFNKTPWPPRSGTTERGTSNYDRCWKSSNGRCRN